MAAAQQGRCSDAGGRGESKKEEATHNEGKTEGGSLGE
jgi:hypothetical protein